MNATDKPQYATPELFDWSLLDSHKLSTLAEWCASTARTQDLLIPEQRHLLPGLRVVLRQIAEMEGVELF